MNFLISGRIQNLTGGESNVLSKLMGEAGKKTGLEVVNNSSFHYSMDKPDHISTAIETREPEGSEDTAKDKKVVSPEEFGKAFAKALVDHQAELSDTSSPYGGTDSPYGVFMSEENDQVSIGVELKDEMPEGALISLDND